MTSFLPDYLRVCVCVCVRASHSVMSDGSSIHGIVQARILEWVAMPSPGDRPNPQIKPGSALPVLSLLSEPPAT